jgi:hypothetical protein
MSATISARLDQNLYVLILNHPNNGKFPWFTTLATNRHACWQAAKPFCNNGDGNWKSELKNEGYTCVRVRLEVQEEQ